MMIRTIQHDDSLDSVWEELVYTEARLLGDKNAKDLAPGITALIDRSEDVARGQRASWRGEIVAQAGVDSADDGVDSGVEGVGDVLLRAVKKDRASPRFTRYFSSPPSEIVRLGLQSEIARVKPWLPSIQGEPEPEVRAAGKALTEHVATGEAALSARERAVADRADQRVRAIYPFIDDVNAVRLSLFGILTGRATERGLAPGWPGGFFRRTQRAPRPRQPA